MSCSVHGLWTAGGSELFPARRSNNGSESCALTQALTSWYCPCSCGNFESRNACQKSATIFVRSTPRIRYRILNLPVRKQRSSIWTRQLFSATSGCLEIEGNASVVLDSIFKASVFFRVSY